MPQVFGPRTNLWSKLSLTLFALAVAIGPLVLWRFELYSVAARIGVPVAQPVPFSHELHVGMGLDCRYCHSSVEQSPFAGIPSTQTCMACHSQIQKKSALLAPVRDSARTATPLTWHRVYSLPDFVYFDHSIHVTMGVACETCHGRVDQMPVVTLQAPLTMQWCLACHRAPEQFVRPREFVFTMGWHPQGDQRTMGRALVQQYHIRSLTDCDVCHR